MAGVKREREESATTDTSTPAASAPSPNTIFVSKLSKSTTREQLQQHFTAVGHVTYCRILLNPKKLSRGLAYIEFEEADNAKRAVKKLHYSTLDGATLEVTHSTVNPAWVHTEKIEGPKTSTHIKKTKEERNAEKSERDKAAFIAANPDHPKAIAANKRAKYEQIEQRQQQYVDKLQTYSKPVVAPDQTKRREDGTFEYKQVAKPPNCTTVFLTNLPFDVSEDILRQRFEPFGNITYLNVVKDAETQKPRGIGYVQYDATEATDRAITLNESELNGRRMRVTYARPLRERYANKPGNNNNNNSNRTPRSFGSQSSYTPSQYADRSSDNRHPRSFGSKPQQASAPMPNFR